MKHFMKNMSKEDKQKMMKLMMPIMKDMQPRIMAEIMGDFNESDCRKMMMEMPLEMREKCRKMMTSYLKILKET